MILKSENKTISSNSIASDLSLIISEFSNTVTKYECEAIIPISMWVEIEDKKSELIRVLNIINDQNVDLSVYDPNYDINSSVNEANNSSPLNSTTINQSSNKNSSDCSPCNPIKIDFSSKFNKPEIKLSLKSTIDSASFIFTSNSELICSSVMVMSNGCIPDLLKVIATLLMSLNTIFSSVNLESLSLSSFISGSIGASLDITIKRAMFMANFSVAKSDCLSNFIKEIINSLPTPENIRANVDKSTIDRFRLNNLGTSGIEKMFNTIEDRISNSGLSGADYISKNLNNILSVIDKSIERVNNWVDGLFQLSNYLPCEKERSNTMPSGIVEEISNILTLINTIVAIIDKKYKNNICNNNIADSSTPPNSTLSNSDVTDIISSLVDVDTIVKNNDGITIAIILPSVELRTVYLDTFGCNLPKFMEKTSTRYINYESSNDSTMSVIPPIGENIGEIESLLINGSTDSNIINNKDSSIDVSNVNISYYIENKESVSDGSIISISNMMEIISDSKKIAEYTINQQYGSASDITTVDTEYDVVNIENTDLDIPITSIDNESIEDVFNNITKTLNINVVSNIGETLCDK